METSKTCGWFKIYLIILRVKTCLKMEISQSQDWVGNAMKKQTAALNHAAATNAMAYLENF